jgi:hypothetical protein
MTAFNAALLRQYLPLVWKDNCVILMLKTGQVPLATVDPPAHNMPDMIGKLWEDPID